MSRSAPYLQTSRTITSSSLPRPSHVMGIALAALLMIRFDNAPNRRSRPARRVLPADSSAMVLLPEVTLIDRALAVIPEGIGLLRPFKFVFQGPG